MAIKRREFIGGVAVTAAATLLRPSGAFAGAAEAVYPPALTGLRGSHAGSFETAHAMALGGEAFPRPETLTDSPYDLVVVGGGISGLAAAHFWRQQHGPASRILILDNHDDFGGHAKRNEFTVDGRHLIGYGGSQSIDTPSRYSPEAKGLLDDLGIDVARFYRYYDRDFPRRHGLGSHWFFDRDHYGDDVLTPNPLGASWLGVTSDRTPREVVDAMPLDPESRDALYRLLTLERDWLAGRTVEEKVAYLRGKSYEALLREDLGMPEPVVLLLRQRSHGIWAVGYDALSGLAAAEAGEPGTTSLGLDDWLWGDDEGEPYIFHFPEGNAAIARLLVRRFIPSALAGNSMEDAVTARLDYSQLDHPDNRVRVRLNATVTEVRHTVAGDAVDVVYQHRGAGFRVQGKQVVLACYNHVIPHICPELPSAQAEALRWPEKAPLVYANLALRNWRAFKAAGLYHFSAVRDFWGSGSLDFPVSMPGYDFAKTPDDPIVLHMVHVPTDPGKPAREQYRNGRRSMLSLSFADYEEALRRQLTGMLGGHGFDFDRDVAAITVNRWPHGYAYEYMDLWDPIEWGRDAGPHVVGRQPYGRVAIANSDSAAYAYVNGAIDAAWRAVNDLRSV